MKTVLLVLLAVVVALAVSVLPILGLRDHIKSRRKRVPAGPPEVPPTRIKLELCNERKPGDRAAWDRWIAGFRGAGFVSVGTFAARENESILVHGMTNTQERASANVCWSELTGVSAEVVSRNTSGVTFAHSTIREMGWDSPEFSRYIRVPGADAAHLLKAHLAERGPGPFQSALPETFTEGFEAFYARYMDWRMVRGITEHELRRNLSLFGQSVSEEVLAATLERLRGQYAAMLERTLREKFLSESGMGAAEWEALEHRVILVRENSTVQELLGELAGRLGWDDDGATPSPDWTHAEGVLAALPAREGFRTIVTPLAGERAFRLLGEVRGPVVADVYVAPEYPSFTWADTATQADGIP